MTASSGIGPARTPGLTRADVAMIVTRGQAWRDALHRDLAQLGLEWLEADSLMEDYSVGGMDLDLYWRAQRVIREHRDMQEALFHASRIADGASRHTLIEAAAERIAAGEDLFAVRCGLAVDLARRGMGQVLLPTVFDPRLWEAVDSRDPRRIAAYLDACETLYIPAVDGVTR
ncbi:hypothetical protein [uncultured Actinomyces sp.]|uniref:hypothetical protein n=1 Tax=uncultured Actinomyces sp. TaxID=249061 RepID=UPI00288B518B|nr:hypothetical protein [uncultured Actinomyces sp.]